MPLMDPKMRNCVASALKCLKCEICEKDSLELLPGLCTSHVFCKQCSIDNSSCPSCKTTFNMKNSSVFFSVSPEILSTLHGLESILMAKSIIEKTPAKVPQRKSISNAPSTEIQQTALTTSSPAKSDVTVSSSTRRGRRSSLSSPMPDVNKRNTKGETLVHTACIKKNFEEVKRLLGLGANCCVRDYNGWTPLHEAAQTNQLDIARVLLEHGAKVNAAGGEEYLTPLHDAVSANFTDMVELLLKFGADPKQLSIKSETCKDMTKDPTILSLLKKAEHQPFTPQTLDGSSTINSILFADGRPLIIMSSGLDKIQKATLATFMKTFSAKSTSKPTIDLKVVIAADENNVCKTSSAVLAGIAAGAWVLRPAWVQACLENGRLVDPESYELYSTSGSNCGQIFKKARINRENMLPGLFAGCNVFLGSIENYGKELSKDTVMQLVKVMGGCVVTRCPDPEDTSDSLDIPFHADRAGPLAKCSHLIIFERGKTKKNFIEFNMKHIKALQYSWLLNCIENFNLINP